MRNRKRSRGRILNQIIFCQLTLVIVLFIVLKITTIEEKQENFEVSPSPTVMAGQIESITPTIPVQVTVTPAIETPVITKAPTITPEPTDTPEVDDAGNSSEDSQSTANASVPAFAVGMSAEFIKTLADTMEGTILSTGGIKDFVYYQQTDSRWANLYYGDTDTIGEYGCAPTCLSMVVSTLTDYTLDPVQMSAWANEKGYWYPQQGSLHSIIAEGAESFGLTVVGAENTPGVKEVLEKALTEGKLVVALMGKGSFTRSGHFIVLRGITEDGMVYVADPNSKENTDKTWSLTQIVNEAKSWAGANGPFWIVSR